jgi:hypothetical protein
MTRNESLQFAGVVCIIAALVGGGVKFFGHEIGALSSSKRQIALAAFGVILIAWGPVSTYVSEPRRIASSISGEIDEIVPKIRGGTVETATTPNGQTDIVPLTKVYVRIEQERSKLGSELHELLLKKAGLALATARGQDVSSEWEEVNSEIASKVDWP